MRSGFPPITDRALVHDCVAHDIRKSILLLDMAATLTNHGDGDDMLIGATSPVTERVEIHIMEMDGDVMRMAPLPGGIELPAGGSVTLAPGGLHLMLMELDSPIVEGEPVPVTLEFQHAEPMEIELRVLPVGESPEGHHHESGHSHGHNHAAH